jgi:hypothetical protein
MDLTDERLHKSRVPWAELVAEGYEPRKVMLEAQRQGLWKIARSARTRIANEKRDALK